MSIDIAMTKLEWNVNHDDQAVLTTTQQRVVINYIEELEQHMKSLIAPEPDKQLAGHPENTVVWQDWHDNYNAALAWAKENLR